MEISFGGLRGNEGKYNKNKNDFRNIIKHSTQATTKTMFP